MIKFLYLRNEKKTPIATIAYELEPKPSKRLTYNYSCCHVDEVSSYGGKVYRDKMDTPSKALGRDLALGRLVKNPQLAEFTGSPVKDLLALVVSEDSKFPRRMKRLATRMLAERNDTMRPTPDQPA